MVKEFSSATDLREIGGFFAALPLVLRPCFNDDVIINKAGRRVNPEDLRGEKSSRYSRLICAADSRGVAAFIGLSPGRAVILQSREDAARGGDLFFFRVSCGDMGNIGGIDAQ
jgi:hypothetical protein